MNLLSGLFSSLPRLMPPACPNCLELMNIKGFEPWTLLRGHQLDRYTFECNDCGHSVTRLSMESALAGS